MWSQLFQRITAPGHLAGVSIWLGSEGYEMAAVLLRQEKGIVKIERSVVTTTWEDLAGELTTLKIPVVLHIDGRGVLHKTIEKKEEHTAQDLLNLIIPNARAGEFTIQRYDTATHHHVSIVRKDTMQNILDLFQQKEIHAIQIFLGPFVASRLHYVAEQPIHSLRLRGSILEFKDNTISQHIPQGSSEPDQLLTLKDGDQLPAALLLPYAAAISSFIHRHEKEFTFLSTEFQGLRNNWEQKQLFHRSLKVALTFIFALLLINTILFMQATKKNAQLSGRMQHNQKILQRLESLQKDVEHKKKFITQTAWGHNPRAAFYADRIAASLPEQVWLTAVNIHPVDEKVLKEERRHLFRNTVIWVKGKCNNPLIVNEWIKALGNADWVDHILDQEYEYNSRERSGDFFFKVQLNPLQ